MGVLPSLGFVIAALMIMADSASGAEWSNVAAIIDKLADFFEKYAGLV